MRLRSVRGSAKKVGLERASLDHLPRFGIAPLQLGQRGDDLVERLVALRIDRLEGVAAVMLDEVKIAQKDMRDALAHAISAFHPALTPDFFRCRQMAQQVLFGTE